MRLGLDVGIKQRPILKAAAIQGWFADVAALSFHFGAPDAPALLSF